MKNGTCSKLHGDGKGGFFVRSYYIYKSSFVWGLAATERNYTAIDEFEL